MNYEIQSYFQRFISNSCFPLSIELQEYGIALVENVPESLDGLPQLIKTIFGPESNHYGDYFKVESKMGANNVAYTGATIGLHQDLPYYEKTPSVGFSDLAYLEVAQKSGVFFRHNSCTV